MKQLSILLQQHTPLLHFQHMEEGATLRATEVKPRLDKYIIASMGGVKNIPEEWFMGRGKHLSLNYKMKIVAKRLDHGFKIRTLPKTDNNNNTLTDKWGRELYESKYTLVLGNMGPKPKDELLNFSLADKVGLTILCQDERMRQELTHCLPSFFAANNFGARNNKGFGSFSVVKINDREISWTPTDFSDGWQVMTCSLKGKRDRFEKIRTVFEVIEYYWKGLKSGINYRNVLYSKSFLYTYLNKLGRTWEKRAIKRCFNLGNCSQIGLENNNEEMFGRALLGLSDTFEYRFPNKPSRRIYITHKEIERIKAPIVFKPVFDFEADYAFIYILIDDAHMNSIDYRNGNRFLFLEERDSNQLELPLNMRIDYIDLLGKYMESFRSNGQDTWRFFEPLNFMGKYILGDEYNRVYIDWVR